MQLLDDLCPNLVFSAINLAVLDCWREERRDQVVVGVLEIATPTCPTHFNPL